MEKKEEEEEKEEKIFYMCKSMGHRPLWGRCPKRGPTRDVEAIDRFRFGGWDSYQYLYYKMEAEAEEEAVEAALKSTASTSLGPTNQSTKRPTNQPMYHHSRVQSRVARAKNTEYTDGKQKIYKEICGNILREKKTQTKDIFLG